MTTWTQRTDHYWVYSPPTLYVLHLTLNETPQFPSVGAAQQKGKFSSVYALPNLALDNCLLARQPVSTQTHGIWIRSPYRHISSVSHRLQQMSTWQTCRNGWRPFDDDHKRMSCVAVGIHVPCVSDLGSLLFAEYPLHNMVICWVPWLNVLGNKAYPGCVYASCDSSLR
jgi:hypothetical protein